MATQGIGLYRVQGIVLRGIRLGEADRIVSLLTPTHGKVRAVAKGARRSRSRFGGRLEAFTLVDVLLYRGRGDLDTVTQADIVQRSKRLREDYAAFTAAAAMADAVERTTPTHDVDARTFLLLRGGLQALEVGAADPGMLAHSFLSKFAALGGVYPSLGACVGCQTTARVGFSVERGGAACEACLGREEPRVPSEVFDAWELMLTADWETLGGWAPQNDVRRPLTALTLAFVQWHTESRFKAFGLLATAAP